jgi:hypothetical protein
MVVSATIFEQEMLLHESVVRGQEVPRQRSAFQQLVFARHLTDEEIVWYLRAVN